MDELDEKRSWGLLSRTEVASVRGAWIVVVVMGALGALLSMGGGFAFADDATKLPAKRALTAAETAELAKAEYVYISSTRKDGSLGTPAEIWFWPHDGAVYVGTRPDSWRARRIGWGRPGARIAIGSRDGPALVARGALVRDQPALWAEFCEALAKKYPSSWPRHEKGFRSGYADGSRVLIRYSPVATATADAQTSN